MIRDKSKMRNKNCNIMQNVLYHFKKYCPNNLLKLYKVRSHTNRESYKLTNGYGEMVKIMEVQHLI
jgi:hypothetical protein